jgi:hypothetical protein
MLAWMALVASAVQCHRAVRVQLVCCSNAAYNEHAMYNELHAASTHTVTTQSRLWPVQMLAVHATMLVVCSSPWIGLQHDHGS